MIIRLEAGLSSSDEAREQFVRVADIACISTTLDGFQDRLKQGAHVAAAIALAPEAGEIVGGTQFQEPPLLAPRNLDRLPEAGFSAPAIRFRPTERELAAEAMQVGEPEPLAGLLDKGEALRKV